MTGHNLYTKFHVQTVQRSGTKDHNTDFKSLLKHVCTITTVENLSFFLRHLCPIDDLPCITDINIFKEGIQPLWEDENNICGGKWIMKIKKEVAQRLFERLLVRMAARPFENFDINGIVLSVRYRHAILAIWTRDTSNDESYINIVDEIKKTIGVDFFLNIEYKDNDESIKDLSSYKNTISLAKKRIIGKK
ncbi:Eukaryotic translation initiation factor NCBP [Dictyocoela muelleri]|nr:Eukaryotic translation initiation factor NCBP [Dictyocoela muelleri]